jgi:hypothetical protein
VVWYEGFPDQAASWKPARRVVAKVEFHFGELFPRVGFIVTNLETDSRAVVRFYNKARQGGAMDQRRQAGGEDYAVELPPLSAERGAARAERLAYNLGNLWRRLVLPRRIDNWDSDNCTVPGESLPWNFTSVHGSRGNKNVPGPR